MKKQTTFPIWAIAIALLLSTACQITIPPPATTSTPFATKVEVPFENVALNEWGGNDKMGRDPQLFILMTANDVVKIQPFISEKALQEVKRISWNDYVVIAAFRGVQGCSLYGIGIEHLTVEGDTLWVNAQFWQRPPNSVCQTILTSPYHVVKVRKADIGSAKLKPVLRGRPVDKSTSNDQEKIGTQ